MLQFNNLFTSEYFEFAKNLFENAFPVEERPDFEILQERNPNLFHFHIITYHGKPIGILSYWDFEDFIYIEHFAISDIVRNQGLGKEILTQFLTSHLKQIVMEVEPPIQEMARRRIGFYKRLGFLDNEFEYQQPPYRGNLEFLSMKILSRQPLTKQDFEHVKHMIYTNVYKYTN